MIIDRVQCAAEAIADSLGRYDFRASRRYLITTDVDSLEGFEVWVVAAADVRANAARGVTRIEAAVDLCGVAPVTDPSNVRELDGYSDAVARLKLLFDDSEARPELLDLYEHAGALRGATFAGLAFVNLTNSPIYHADHLSEFQQFTSVVRLNLKGT